MKKQLITCLGVVLAAIMAFAMPTHAVADEIIFGDAGWDSMKFHNAVAMLIAEEAYGYTTDEISGSTAITYNALKTGDIDVYMETWQDSIAPYKEDVEAGRVVELGVNYDDNIQGIYVPRYVIEGDEERGIEPIAPDLKTVEDLKKYSDVFPDLEDPGKGRIYGAISGWQVDGILRNKVAYYGLDEMYNYIDPALTPHSRQPLRVHTRRASRLSPITGSLPGLRESMTWYFWKMHPMTPTSTSRGNANSHPLA